MSEDDLVKRVARAIRLCDSTDEFMMARAAIAEVNRTPSIPFDLPSAPHSDIQGLRKDGRPL